MGINQKIIREVNKKCESDKQMKSLIMELLEIEMEGTGWWKEPYKEVMFKYAPRKEEKNENK